MVVVDSKASVAQTLNTLVKSNVLCAPVFDREANQFTGLVDMLDLVTLLVEVTKNMGSMSQDYVAYMEKEEELQSRTASQISDLSKRNKMCPVPLEATLLDAMRVMSKNHVQRVPVMSVNQKGEFVAVSGLLTQSAVVAFLAKHAAELGPEFSRSLRDMGFEEKKVISISDTTPAIEAFRLMAENRISGLPVLDSDGKLLANISARDLRVIASDPKMFQHLYLDAGDFVTHIRMADVATKTVHPSISVTLEESFQRVIAKLAAAHIHRIYVTDQQRMPVSVISLHDIIAKILE